ncbi:MAG: hypothetical protein AAFY60_03830 [Myxococcota bacterium]
MPSLNLEIVGPWPEENGHTPGRNVLNTLLSALRAGGWEAESEPDNWRDSGWSIHLGRDTQMLVTHVSDQTYWAQITALHSPSLLARLFKKDAWAKTDADVSRCGEILSRELATQESLTVRRWNWDGPADEGQSDPVFRH